MVLIWRLLALLALLLGLVGLLLPLVPTVPFLLLAAWAAGCGWPALEQRLLMHPHLGPPILRWRERGVVPRRAKWAATLGMAGSCVLLWLSPAPLWLRAGLPVGLGMIAAWLWRRPEQ